MKTLKNPARASYQATLETIGKKLTELRISKGYKTQVEFAIAHDLPVTQYWRMEKGAANLTFRSLDKVLAIHGLTIEELFQSIAPAQSA